MLIAFEGGEGSGKSTQARVLADRLDAVLTREPGATALGQRIRALVLETDIAINARAEALLLAADRAQHVAEVIAPALAVGRDVVTDRYLYSSLAYQAFGRGLDADEVRALSTGFAGAPEADLVVFVTVSADVRAQRLKSRPDRIEASGDEFHARVEAGFHAMAAADPQRWVTINGDAAIDEVASLVWQAVDSARQSRAV